MRRKRKRGRHFDQVALHGESASVYIRICILKLFGILNFSIFITLCETKMDLRQNPHTIEDMWLASETEVSIMY